MVNFWYRKHKIHVKLKATANGETTNFSNIDPAKAVSIWENEEVRIFGHFLHHNIIKSCGDRGRGVLQPEYIHTLQKGFSYVNI